MTNNTPSLHTYKTASALVAGDIIRPAGRDSFVEVLAAWPARDDRIEVAAVGKGRVALNLSAHELVAVAASK